MSVVSSLSIVACLCVLLLPLVAKGPTGQSHFWLVFILAAINLVEAVTYAIGRAAIDGDVASGGCKAQGAVMQFASIAGFLWILVFCILLVRSLRTGYDSLSAPVSAATLLPPLIAVSSIAGLSVALLGAQDAFGPATLWCWVTDEGLGVALYYVPLLIIWVCAVLSLATVQRAIRSRSEAVQRELRHRRGSMLTTTNPDATGVQHSVRATEEAINVTRQARRQLCGFIVVFIIFSAIGLFNRFLCFTAGGAARACHAAAALSGDPPRAHLRVADCARIPHVAESFGSKVCDSRGWFAVLLLQGCTMPLQGLANAAIFSRSLRSHWTIREGLPRLLLFRTTTEPSIRLHRVSRAATGEIGLLEARVAAPVVTEEEERRATIFAATWNVGEANPPSAELLRQWLPTGRDAYFFGLQECLAPATFASAIHTALGGSAAFQLVAEERIGSANTALGYHGFIVLFVFISARAADSGAWSRVLASGAAVKRGKKIGAGAVAARASNKGGVGAAFRFHTTTLSVVAAHLAADKKGKKNVRARLTDTRMLLEGLELE